MPLPKPPRIMSEWIEIQSTKDLPKEGVNVLVAFDDGFLAISCLIDDEWDTGANGRRAIYKGIEKRHTSCDPHSWMPIPLPPEKESGVFVMKLDEKKEQ